MTPLQTIKSTGSIYLQGAKKVTTFSAHTFTFSFDPKTIFNLNFKEPKNFGSARVMDETIENHVVRKDNCNIKALMEANKSCKRLNQCNQCGFVFARAFDLKRHLKIHSG